MRDPKETTASRNTGENREAGVAAGNAAFQTGGTAAKMEICHGSVCLGNQKPTHCVCPTDKK